MLPKTFKIIQICLERPLILIHFNKKLYIPLKSLCSRTMVTKSELINKIEEKYYVQNSLVIKDILKTYLNISDDNFYSLIQMKTFNFNVRSDLVKSNLELLKSFKIKEEIIQENLYLAEMEHGVLKKKLLLLSKMNFKELDHGVPFLKLSPKRLLSLYLLIENEKDILSGGNRLYVISDLMKLEPIILAKSIVKRMFVYSISLDKLQQNLKILLDMNVKPENIMKDWWVLIYKTEVVKERLGKMKIIDRKKNLMPWMVKCTEFTLDRSIDIRKTSKEILGEETSTMAYLAERLKCSPDTVKFMASKIPAIYTIRVYKVRDILDYLFSKGYSEKDIILVPRVLAHSLKTLQSRLETLSESGSHPKNLNILCKSRKDFKRYMLSLQSQSSTVKSNE